MIEVINRVIIHRSPDKRRRGQEDAKSAKERKKRKLATPAGEGFSQNKHRSESRETG